MNWGLKVDTVTIATQQSGRIFAGETTVPKKGKSRENNNSCLLLVMRGGLSRLLSLSSSHFAGQEFLGINVSTSCQELHLHHLLSVQ